MRRLFPTANFTTKEEKRKKKKKQAQEMKENNCFFFTNIYTFTFIHDFTDNHELAQHSSFSRCSCLKLETVYGNKRDTVIADALDLLFHLFSRHFFCFLRVDSRHSPDTLIIVLVREVLFKTDQISIKGRFFCVFHMQWVGKLEIQVRVESESERMQLEFSRRGCRLTVQSFR